MAFDFLFKRAVVGADPGAQARADRERRLGKSLIDFVNADLRRLRARVGPFEVQKLINTSTRSGRSKGSGRR